MTAFRRCLQAFLVVTACAGGQAVAADKPDKVSFYFAAHEDDWQLFMNPSAFQDVTDAAAKTVFVHVTAVQRSGIPELNEGMRISFEVQPDKRGRGPQAVELQLL